MCGINHIKTKTKLQEVLKNKKQKTQPKTKNNKKLYHGIYVSNRSRIYIFELISAISFPIGHTWFWTHLHNLRCKLFHLPPLTKMYLQRNLTYNYLFAQSSTAYRCGPGLTHWFLVIWDNKSLQLLQISYACKHGTSFFFCYRQNKTKETDHIN